MTTPPVTGSSAGQEPNPQDNTAQQPRFQPTPLVVLAVVLVGALALAVGELWFVGAHYSFDSKNLALELVKAGLQVITVVVLGTVVSLLVTSLNRVYQEQDRLKEEARQTEDREKERARQEQDRLKEEARQTQERERERDRQDQDREKERIRLADERRKEADHQRNLALNADRREFLDRLRQTYSAVKGMRRLLRSRFRPPTAALPSGGIPDALYDEQMQLLNELQLVLEGLKDDVNTAHDSGVPLFSNQSLIAGNLAKMEDYLRSITHEHQEKYLIAKRVNSEFSLGELPLVEEFIHSKEGFKGIATARYEALKAIRGELQLTASEGPG